MRRREFIALLGGAAVAWPLPARAQQPAMPAVGFLDSRSPDAISERLRAFRQGLKESGYVEGENVAIEYRWAENQMDRLPDLAAELVRRRVAVIATAGDDVALVAKAATTPIPIVFLSSQDPVKLGLVASLARPGGNVTGITFINSQLGPKRIQLLRLLNPKTAVIAVLVNPKNPNAVDAKTFEAAGRSIGLQIVIINASTEMELKEAFSRAVELHADALLIHVDALFNDGAGQSQIIALAGQHRLPTMMANVTFPARGGLISYGADTRDLNRQAGVYVARILRGEKPADLPVVQPTNFALRVNLKTAKALGLSIPESFLLLADEVIE
jgi:putative ABC transport system substrate-binding protein